MLLMICVSLSLLCFAETAETTETPDNAIIFDGYQPTDPNQSAIIYDAGKTPATLIIMRASGTIGWTVSLSSPLFVNGLLVDALKYQQYTSCKVAPGRVKLSSFNNQRYNEFYLDVLPGETYYIDFYMVSKGGSVATPKFELLDEKVALEKLKKCVKTSYPIE